MRLLDFLEEKAGFFAAVAALVLALLGTADVLSLLLLNKPITGTVEFSSMLLVCVLFLGMAESVRGGDNVSVDLLRDRLKGRARQGLILFNKLCTLLFFFVLAYLSWKLALHSLDKGDVMAGAINFKLWPFKMTAALGATLAMVAVLVRVIRPQTSEE